MLLIGTLGFVYLLFNPAANYILQIGIYSFLIFTCFMICHGELYRIRPESSHLTMFYLMVSIGGAVGGIFVNFIAPLIFKGYWELNYGIALVWLLLAIMALVRETDKLAKRPRFIFDNLVVASAILVLILTIVFVNAISSDALLSERNFYGVIHVKKVEEDFGPVAYTLSHGVTFHGSQFIVSEKRDLPTTYYTEKSGVGLAILNHPKRGSKMSVGVLGLGIGTLSVYGQPGDEYRFYEINPSMIELANGQGGYFSFLKDSKANVTVIPGDARISLERELEKGEGHQFDVLVLDTFSSDSIPVHLVTKEAFELYIQHLSEKGVFAAHISNRNLNFLPIFCQLSHYFNMKIVTIKTEEDADTGGMSSIWVLMARDPELLNTPAIVENADTLTCYSTHISMWTDDYSNLLQILK
jgi:spermidine synthase